jgi:mRNA-degrading endonuclease HigB of HigAB toxin-antitoxin module
MALNIDNPVVSKAKHLRPRPTAQRRGVFDTRLAALRPISPTQAAPPKARWSSAADVKRSYATASRIVFNIKGNDYRLIVATDFDKRIVWIKWIGTHKDYDKIDVKGVQHGG